jgi:hypothetical protein
VRQSLRLFIIVVVLFVSGCTSIPLSSMIALSKLDFMTLDFAKLRVAMSLPKNLRPKSNGVVMTGTFQISNAPAESVDVNLQESSDPADYVGLQQSTAQTDVRAYRLPAGEIKKLNDVRRRVQIAKSKGETGTLSFGIATKDFCSKGAIGQGPILSTTWLASAETQGYIVVTQDLDLQKDATVKEQFKNLQPCSN